MGYGTELGMLLENENDECAIQISKSLTRKTLKGLQVSINRPLN